MLGCVNPRLQLKRFRARAKPKMSCAVLAKALGCSRQFVAAIEAGTDSKVPGLSLAARIEEVTGIPACSWDRLVTVKHYRPRKRGVAA